MVIKKLVLFFTLFLLCSLYPGVSAQNSNFSDAEDKYRIVYAENYSSPFLVVERVDKNKVVCRRYKSDKKALIRFSPDELRKLYFFEDRPFNEFDLINGALLCYKEQPYLLLFVKTYFKASPRIKLLMQFEEAQAKFSENLKKTRKANKKLSDADDKIDALYEILNTCDLHQYIFKAIDSGDWILAFYIYKCHLDDLNSLCKGYSPNSYFCKDVKLNITQTEKKLLQQYNTYIKKDFPELELYKQATGSKWKKPVAMNFQDFYLIAQSWQDAFEITMRGEQFSSSGKFRTWAENMLVLLSLGRTMPITEEWRKNFSKELNVYIKTRKR